MEFKQTEEQKKRQYKRKPQPAAEVVNEFGKLQPRTRGCRARCFDAREGRLQQGGRHPEARMLLQPRKPENLRSHSDPGQHVATYRYAHRNRRVARARHTR